MAEPMTVVGERVMLTSPGFEWCVYVPPTFTGVPVDVLDVLVRTKAVLAAEEHWMKAQLFLNHNPQLDPKDPFCNSWQACLMGAAAMVTLGARREFWTQTMNPEADPEYGDWEMDEDWASFDSSVVDRGHLYTKAMDYLKEHLPEVTHPGYNPETGEYDGESEVVDFASVWEFNDWDHTTHEQVIAALDAAIAAEQEVKSNA